MQRAFIILKTGGYCGIGICLAYTAITLLYVMTGTLDGTIENKLQIISENETAWWRILSLSVLTDLLLFPFTYALLKLTFPLEKDIVLFGVLSFVLFAIIDLTLTWPSFELLITIANDYMNTSAYSSNEELLTMASLLDKLHSSRLFSVYVILLMSIGIVIFSLALKRHLHYTSIYVIGLLIGFLGVSGVLSTIFLGTSGIIAVVISVLTTIWIAIVSLKLFKLSRGAKAIVNNCAA